MCTLSHELCLPCQPHLLGRAGPVGMLQQDGGQVVPTDGRGKGSSIHLHEVYHRRVAWRQRNMAWHGMALPAIA